MNRPHEIAQLLVACWALGTRESKIPTSHGLLDKALERARDQGAFPPWVRDNLHFVHSRIGLQCVELPLILDWAQSAELTSVPNPSYSYTELRVSSDVARILLKRLGISESDATAWGKMLKDSADEVKADVDAQALALAAV